MSEPEATYMKRKLEAAAADEPAKKAKPDEESISSVPTLKLWVATYAKLNVDHQSESVRKPRLFRNKDAAEADLLQELRKRALSHIDYLCDDYDWPECDRHEDKPKGQRYSFKEGHADNLMAMRAIFDVIEKEDCYAEKWFWAVEEAEFSLC